MQNEMERGRGVENTRQLQKRKELQEDKYRFKATLAVNVLFRLAIDHNKTSTSCRTIDKSPFYNEEINENYITMN